MMKRRLFLTKIASTVGLLLSSRVFAEKGHDVNLPMDHSNAAMPMNSHGVMPSMDHSSHDMNAITENFILGNRTLTHADISRINQADHDLLPIEFFPKQAPLPTLSKLINESQTPNHFKATLRAHPINSELIPEKQTNFWVYNDAIPGPLIEVYEGDSVEITLINDLPQATTLHWHGLLVPPSEDGNPQDEVKPGERRTYRFTLPMGCAGTYWYHPHGHNTVAEQVYHGLAGPFIVKAKDDPFAALPEQRWLISDLKIDKNGAISDNSINDWMNGREGQFVLINGAFEPTIKLASATRVRLWNACSGRYLNLNLETSDIYLIATDGGFIEQPEKIKTLLLSPGERAEVVIIPKVTGIQAFNALAYNRGKMGRVPKEETRILAQVHLKESATPELPTKIRSLPEWGAATQFKTVEYSEVMEETQLLFYVNGKIHDMARVDLTSKCNEVEEWTLFNNSHMDHNFHIHGTQFLVLEHELNGERFSPKIVGLKDTVNLKPYETVRLKMKQDYVGLRMYHCHILEHESLGMMGQLEIV